MASIKRYTKNEAYTGCIHKDTFLWWDRHGKLHAPADMSTKHVFFTLRMIWNHSAPKNMQIRPFKPYDFRPFYTKAYMIAAVYALVTELDKRDDMQPYFVQCLKIIWSHLHPLDKVAEVNNG